MQEKVIFLRIIMYSTIQSCENVRKSLEKCDVDADIDLFVRERATGSERPQPVPYVNFYHPTDNLGGSGQ